MGNLNETEKWEENIYQLETSDPVLGGADGISNRAPRQLANRTKWLKKKTEEAAQSLAEHVRSRNHPDATLTAKGFTQLSSATNSTSETLAATPKAVKAAYDLAAGKAPASHTHPWSQITGVPAASLTAKGTVQLSSAINSTSEILAATPKAVKAAYDLANGKQPADATLTALAGLATAADRLPYFTGADRAELATLTAIGRAIIAKGSIKDVLNYLGLGEGSALPVGVPVPWPTATPPAGWLQCNGATFTKEQYPVLVRVYPTLRLPDLRGEFIRGWDGGRKVDTGRALLSFQEGTIVSVSVNGAPY